MQTEATHDEPLPLGVWLNQYALWTESVWMGSAGDSSVRDHAVMGLGIPGECGEVAEVLLAGADRQELVKELGDVAYYWARVCKAFAVEPAIAWPDETRTESQVDSAAELAVLLCLAAGKVAEALKKCLRDTTDDTTQLAAQRVKLVHGLSELAKAWRAISGKYGLTTRDVLAANQRKVIDRQARSVMRGNGNDR